MLKRSIVRPALRVFDAYKGILARRPISTQLAIGTLLVTVGDTAAQHIVEQAPLRDHDWRRMGNMVLLRGLLHSSMIIYWYRFLQYALPLPRASRYGRLAVHLTLDQGFFGPGNVAFFFVASGILEGKTEAEIRTKLDDRLWQTITSAWLIWVPFQFVTFRFISMDYRLVAGQVVAIFWNCFMSYQNANARIEPVEGIRETETDKRPVHRETNA